MERVLGIKTHLGIKAGHPQVGWNHNSSGNPGQVVQARVVVHVDGWVRECLFCPTCGDRHLFWDSALATCLGDLGRSGISYSG